MENIGDFKNYTLSGFKQQTSKEVISNNHAKQATRFVSDYKKVRE